MSFQIRRSTEKELPKIIKMINEAAKDAYEYRPYDENMLRQWMQESNLTILVGEENEKIIGLIAYEDSHFGEEIEWLTVPERPDRKLVEKNLISEAEKLVKRGKVFTVVDEGSPKTQEWIDRGYTQEGGLYHMVARLGRLRTLPLVPEEIELRSLRQEEEKEFVDAVNAGFEAERVELGDIQRWKTENPPFDEKWIHVAETNGKIVSVVVAKPDTRYNSFYKAKRGYLGPAATLPEHRCKNLASALTVRAMNFLFEKGMDSVALHTSEKNVASVALLEKIGFRVGHNWKFMRKILPQQSCQTSAT
jgi:ribosomal protein S18 acetylase RimI-like enzyme